MISMKKRPHAWQLISYNRRTLLIFELLYKTIGSSIALPLLQWSFNAILSVTGFYFLTAENLFSFLTDLRVIAALIPLIFLYALYLSVDIFAIIHILDQSYQREKTDTLETLRFAAKRARKMMHPNNMQLFFVTLLLVPFLHFGIGAIALGTVSLPGTLIEELSKRGNPVFFIGAYFVLAMTLIRPALYSLHYFTLENASAHTAFTKSRLLGRGHRISDYGSLLVIQGVLCLLYWAVAAAGLYITALLQHAFGDVSLTGTVLSSAAVLILGILLFIFMALFVPAGVAVISILFYHHKEFSEEPVIHSERLPDRQSGFLSQHARFIAAFLFAVSLTVCVSYIYGVSHGKYALKVEGSYTSGVTAHRGASKDYPENTMAAFLGAFEQGADWIELDVQMSRDKQVFVMHDMNFRRTTGVNAYAYELDYEEIAELDAGSFFHPDFAGERIPLLSDVIDLAKEKGIRLNIELKYDPHTEGLEEAVAALIEDMNFVSGCVVTSQNYRCLEAIRAANKDIRTVYVMSVAYGSFDSLEAADDFSLESTFISKNLVRRMHQSGHEVYAWTVNSQRQMERMLDLGVDNLITDNVPLARQCVMQQHSSDLVSEFVSRLTKMFR